MKTYWLPILADRPPQSDTPTDLLIRANAPDRTASGARCPQFTTVRGHSLAKNFLKLE
jgi:hypothetical protein